MKYLKLMFVIALFAGLSSCDDKAANTDTKEIAEDHNEAKYDESSKEKDAQFLVNAAEINLAEIQLGAFAQQNSKNAEVISLGMMMEEAHRASLKDLTALAAKKLITIPTAPTETANEMLAKLKGEKINDFDKAYCDMMVSQHTDAVAMFDNAATVSADDDIKSWATSTLTVLRMHLDKAMVCQKQFESKK
ncbi:MAG: DUF4142 domain-containing protein [Bacteroidetes bacterium]|nr:DUF4142 domain-containing protein [Bacteroidota bacterium]